MRKMKRKSLFSTILISTVGLSFAGMAHAANAPVAGEVKINEYVANSSTTEWIELYNTTNEDKDISGYYIDDLANGGGAPKAIPANTIIAAGGFYVMDTSSFLNNGGDSVRFLDPSQETVLDSTSYTSSTSEQSRFRFPDGGDWDASENDSPTYNASNGSVSPPGANDITINEYMANSATTEWVELYNSSANALDISGYYIDDIDGGGGAPKVIPNGTVIAAGGYYVMEFTGLLNNGGDDVRFLDSAQTVLDSHTYNSSSAESSRYRFPDGGDWSGVEADSPSKGATNPGTGDTPWVAGNFEVRIFDVEQGDSQLVIFPSGYTILIDAHEGNWNSGAGAALVAAKIRAITGGSHINVAVLSHFHLDHIGYAGYGGFWGLIENEGITFDKVIERDGGFWSDGAGGGTVDGVCDPDLEIVWTNAGTQSGTARNWICYSNNPANTKIYPISEKAILHSTTQINPPDADALVTIVQVNADGVTMVDGVTPLTGDHTAEATPPSENDYSIGLNIRYGLIDYATAGDSDGEYATSSFGYTYNNVEAVLGPRFGKVDVMMANHHGSGHSTNQAYVDALDPDASVISCGDNTFGHPGQDVLDRLNATGDLYITNNCDQTRNYGAATIVQGDVILKSTDGTNYTFNGSPYVASDAGSGGGSSTYTIADVLINEIYPKPASGGSEWIELFNPTPEDINISGGWIDDKASGGGSPIQIPTGTVIVAGGYWSTSMNNYLNNSGDDARLLESDQSTVVDSFTYTSSTRSASFYRSPDGGSWSPTVTTGTTEGTSNP